MLLEIIKDLFKSFWKEIVSMFEETEVDVDTKPVEVDREVYIDNAIYQVPQATIYKDINGAPDIAILVGHNSVAQGADNYKGESEFKFNSRIARKLLPKINKQAVIIKRPAIADYTANCKHVKKLVEALEVPLVLSLHFNAYDKPAYGAEALLITTMSEIDNKLGDKITDLLNEKLGFKERGEDGVKLLRQGTRAYKMHSYVEAAGSLLVTIEPCFANIKHKESEALFENEDKYVDILVEAINEIV